MGVTAVRLAPEEGGEKWSRSRVTRAETTKVLLCSCVIFIVLVGVHVLIGLVCFIHAAQPAA